MTTHKGPYRSSGISAGRGTVSGTPEITLTSRLRQVRPHDNLDFAGLTRAAMAVKAMRAGHPRAPCQLPCRCHGADGATRAANETLVGPLQM